MDCGCTVSGAAGVDGAKQRLSNLQEALGRSGLEGPGLNRTQRTLYGLGVVFLRYLWARADQFSAAQHWGDLPRGCGTPALHLLCHVSACVCVQAASIAHAQLLYCGKKCMNACACSSALCRCFYKLSVPLMAPRSWGWLAWWGMRSAETAFKVASLANFLAFLRFGKYR